MVVGDGQQVDIPVLLRSVNDAVTQEDRLSGLMVEPVQTSREAK